MAPFKESWPSPWRNECLGSPKLAIAYATALKMRQRYLSLPWFISVLLAITLIILAKPAQAAFNRPVPLDFAALLKDSLEPSEDRTEISNSTANSALAPIRRTALKEAALSYGARSALAHRTYELTQSLEHNQQLLGMIYNFAVLLLNKNVMPPVLSAAQTTVKQPEANLLRVADAVYRIERQAQFVTVPTHWRDYLIHDFHAPVAPPASVLLPKNDAEKALWQQALLEGWKLGRQQAEQIFQQSLARLERDYSGMILYRSLLARRMISAPYVAEANLGVTGNGKQMQLNDRLLRITAKPKFTFDAAQWRPRAALKKASP